jgi:hypothetical protein
MNRRTFLTAVLTSIIFSMVWTFVILSFNKGVRTHPGEPPQGGVIPRHADASQFPIDRELKRIFDEDQSDSRPYDTRDQKAETDSRARSRVNAVSEILKKERLRSPDDYYHAAMVLQHSNRSEDFLRAHVLATVAGFKGHRRGAWLSAASLDLFLMSVGRPQIFGTIYGRDNFKRYEIFLSDTIRNEYCVPPLDVQIKNEEFIERGGGHIRRWARECE